MYLLCAGKYASKTWPNGDAVRWTNLARDDEHRFNGVSINQGEQIKSSELCGQHLQNLVGLCFLLVLFLILYMICLGKE